MESRKKSQLIAVGAAVVGLVIGVAIGQGSEAPEPETEVIVETVTETEIEEVAPEVCFNAIEHAYAAIQAGEDLVNVKVEIINTIMEGEWTTEMADLSDKQDEVIERMEGLQVSFITQAFFCHPEWDPTE